MPIPTRAQWQKIRDDAKVPKGAAKVSVGDAIEKVHKSFKPTSIAANKTDTQKLLDVLDSYIKTVKAKYPAFETVFNTKVKDKATRHMAFLDDIIKARTEYSPRYQAVANAYKAYINQTGTPKQIASAIEQLRGCIDAFVLIDPGWAERGKTARKCHIFCNNSAALSQENDATMKQFLKDAAKM